MLRFKNPVGETITLSPRSRITLFLDLSKSRLRELGFLAL
jgi:hypothetical protein